MPFDRLKYDLARYHRLKNEYAAILGGKCASCGSSDDLEFDHIERATKKFTIGNNMFRPRQVILPELEKCQLLCQVCHKSKSDDEMRVPHGGGMSGRRNCHCAPCKAQKSQWNREYKKLRKNMARPSGMASAPTKLNE